MTRSVSAQNVLVGRTITQERLRKGISQGDLSRGVGVSVRTIQAWEMGRDAVPEVRKAALTSALALPAGALDLPDVEPVTADERALLDLYRRVPERLRALLRRRTPAASQEIAPC